jgi:DNA-binding CsgD family transcriptional regulator
MTMRTPAVRSSHHEISAAGLMEAALAIADSRSLNALRDQLCDRADSLIGNVAMGLYLFDRADQLRYVWSRFAPQGFLDQYGREYKSDSMLDCIVSEHRTVDGFHFHGPGRWQHSGNYALLRGWGFHHNMGGALIVDDRIAGVLFVATAQDADPFERAHVARLDLMCRAGSLALAAMRSRERLVSELANVAPHDWGDLIAFDADRPVAGNRGGDNRLIAQLPARSREVAHLLCQGHSNKAIAREIGISIHTVKEHVQNLCRRFGAHNRTDLAHRLLTS